MLASAVPSRRVLPETEQPVREVGQVLFAGLLGQVRWPDDRAPRGRRQHAGHHAWPAAAEPACVHQDCKMVSSGDDPSRSPRSPQCEIGVAEAGKAQVLGLDELERPREPRGYFFTSIDLDLDPATGRARLSYRRVAECFTTATGWTLRHTRIGELKDDGCPLPVLQKITGTGRYAP